MTDQHAKPPARRHGLLTRLAIAGLSAPVHFYRIVISPLTPPSCRFQPTCSQYMLEALEVHGPLRGLWLGVRRLARCHPVRWLGGSSGLDPVPPRAESGSSRD